MATHFERQLEALHVQIITMGSFCEKAISLSNKAIRGEDCIKAIFETDREIDTKEREIENLCMRILLHQQPVARDLREVSAALKMISDMERIGDQAADIADLSKYIDEKHVEIPPLIGKILVHQLCQFLFDLIKCIINLIIIIDYFSAKYMERIGDHAVNIAEWVEYAITGEHRNNEHQMGG